MKLVVFTWTRNREPPELSHKLINNKLFIYLFHLLFILFQVQTCVIIQLKTALYKHPCDSHALQKTQKFDKYDWIGQCFQVLLSSVSICNWNDYTGTSALLKLDSEKAHLKRGFSKINPPHHPMAGGRRPCVSSKKTSEQWFDERCHGGCVMCLSLAFRSSVTQWLVCRRWIMTGQCHACWLQADGGLDYKKHRRGRRLRRSNGGCRLVSRPPDLLFTSARATRVESSRAELSRAAAPLAGPARATEARKQNLLAASPACTSPPMKPAFRASQVPLFWFPRHRVHHY